MSGYDGNWLERFRAKRVVASLCVVGFLGATNAGCFGNFAATRALWTWNKGVSGNKFLQWLVFLALVIVPVYELFGLADVLVINSLEFWTGSNPVGMNGAAETERWVTISPTQKLHLVRNADGSMIAEVVEDGRVVNVRTFVATEDGFEVTNELGAVVVRVKQLADGSVEISGQDGQPIAVASSSDVQSLAALYERGGHAALAQAVVEGAGLSTPSVARP
ncbi:DUF3332 domain-containing protein [Myxococcota bacterium]|nr:DUF3332 domain-containing protein [Myxococcota bacterium]